jgi:hypothetical protein
LIYKAVAGDLIAYQQRDQLAAWFLVDAFCAASRQHYAPLLRQHCAPFGPRFREVTFLLVSLIAI